MEGLSRRGDGKTIEAPATWKKKPKIKGMKMKNMKVRVWFHPQTTNHAPHPRALPDPSSQTDKKLHGIHVASCMSSFVQFAHLEGTCNQRGACLRVIIFPPHPPSTSE